MGRTRTLLALVGASLGFAALVPAVALAPAGAVAPTPGEWSPVVDWNGLVAIHLTVSPTGDVLMWDREKGLTSARRWNPNTGAFTSTPGLATTLFCAFQTRLPDGTLAVVGGTGTASASGLAQMQFFDWNTNTWRAGPSMRTPRWYPTVVQYPDGRLVAMGGQVKKGLMANVTELYDPATNRWVELPGLSEPKALGLYPQALLAPNGQILVAKNGSGNTAYMDVANQRWTTLAKAPPQAASGVMAMYDTGKVLLYNVGKTRQDAYVMDLRQTSARWRKVGSAQFGRKKFSTVVLPDGRVLAIGGSTDGSSVISKALMTPEVWDPQTEAWSPLPNLGVPRMYHSNALLLPDGRVVAAGGGRSGSAPNFPNAEFYSPQYLRSGPRPSITGMSSPVWTEGATVELNVSASAGLAQVVLMGLPSVTHGIDTQQRRLTLVPTPAGAGKVRIQVPNAMTAPAGHYYAIVLDSNGVPSAARIVRLAASGSGSSATAVVAPEAGAAVARIVVDTAPQDQD